MKTIPLILCLALNIGDAELLNLLRERYARDIATSAGRRAWHGALARQIVDTNALVKVEIHADGAAFTNAWKRVTPADLGAKAAKEAAKRPRRAITNGVPARLAAARVATEAVKAEPVKIVTETITINP